MLTISQYNPTVPAIRRATFAGWPFLETAFRPFPQTTAAARPRVKETDDAYLFDADLPGYEPKEINLSLQENTLTLSAEHKDGDDQAERFCGRSFHRAFSLEGIDTEGITAQYKNGVLRVTLPKEKTPETPAPRRIEIR